MYTNTGTFEEAVSFIEGFTSGYVKGYVTGRQAGRLGTLTDWLNVSPTKDWRDISESIALELGSAQAELFRNYRSRFSSDAEATADLLRRVRDYYDSTPPFDAQEGQNETRLD
jgi:hypothetical protein